MNHSYEIEIKTLLGSKANAEKLKDVMRQKDSKLVHKSSHTQLNHYFSGGDLGKLSGALLPYLPADKVDQLEKIVNDVKDFSVRTRWADGRVIFVLKASIDDTTSSNGTARLEFENQMAGLSLEQLDQILLDSGFQYQAKWSRAREEYIYKDVAVSIDKNAGYGYLAEFELVAEDPDTADFMKESLRVMMTELGVVELPQDRLARMFDYYNNNWQDYYGTDKVFNIE